MNIAFGRTDWSAKLVIGRGMLIVACFGLMLIASANAGPLKGTTTSAPGEMHPNDTKSGGGGTIHIGSNNVKGPGGGAITQK